MRDTTYRRNFAALLGDAIFFGLALTFASSTTVLPDLVRQLTDSQVIVGLLLAVTNGAWLLPQMVYAHFLATKRRKKPFVLLGASIGRPAYLLLALALLLGLRDPRVILILLFAVQVVFLSSDALAAVAWFDLYAKAIPVNRRGRLVGIAQAIRGLLAFGSGALIAFALGAAGPPYPLNYALIFSLASLCLLMSLGFIALVREPDEPVEETPLPWGPYLRGLLETLRRDRPFRRLLFVRLLAGFDALALSFYIIFAIQKVGLDPNLVGAFTTTQTVGGIAGSVVFGTISERWGNKRVLQTSTVLALIAPLIGLTLAFSGVGPSAGIAVLYGGVFFLIGMTLSAMMFGFFNYALEMAPAGQRPTYMGLFNTLSGALVLLPPLGGLLLQQTSYGTLFAVTAAVLVLAHALTWGLPAHQRG